MSVVGASGLAKRRRLWLSCGGLVSSEDSDDVANSEGVDRDGEDL